ncbi:pentatricopeptide repeat-containing protein, partial [Trifolium medium]|nr:pentatricopeptide repeat-containing protein [Trifolium medium]
DKITDAVECFRTMLEHDVIPRIPIMNTLLTAMVSRNMISDARELYDEMVERGICDCYTFHVVMGACLNEGKFEEVEKFFEEAKVRGLELDATAYSIVVQAVCSRLNLNLACELLKEMRELGWVPSEGIYTTVILACVKQGNVVEALRLKDEMVSSGFCINLVVAASLMKGHCVRGDVNLALQLFDEIVEGGVVPNEGIFSLLIKGCSKIGNMEKAYELYTQMKLLGIQPTTAIVNFLLKGFWKQNLVKNGLLDLLENAYGLLDEAVELDDE